MILRLLVISTAAIYLTACQTQTTWYEQSCIQFGFKPGTPEFDNCPERDLTWVDHGEP